MELCQGDITKQEWVLWNVTLSEAVEWVRYIGHQRYEWVEIIGHMFGGGQKDGKTDKKCRAPAACAMCRKKCGQRLH